MRIYFDTEFTGLQKNTSLVSIGLVSDDGKELYLEFTDYVKEQCDEWIKDNVLNNTIMSGDSDILDIVLDETNYHKGTKEELKGVLLHWLHQFDSVELVSDVCHYDMVLFIDIFGTAFDLPKNVCPVCYDINSDIAKEYNISVQEAFDMSRETILQELDRVVKGSKHNSLYDAKVTKEIYNSLRGR